MKGSVILIFLLPLISQAQGADEYHKNGIHFFDNMTWQQIKVKAKAEHKYIFVDCFTTWCRYCKEMDRQVFSNSYIGKIINDSFLSIKVQCDTSNKDGDEVKDRYADAHQFVIMFNFHAYPYFLFFSPDGELVHQGIGYYDSVEFINLVEKAMDSKKQYFTLLRKYQQGERDYASMPYLASSAFRFNDSTAYYDIERQYIQGYINRLSDAAICDSSILQLLRNYAKELRSDDRSFRWVIEHAELADSVLKKRGFSFGLIVGVVYREEVKPAITFAEISNLQPDWNKITRIVAKKVGNSYAKGAILRGKMEWYEYKKDWENYYSLVIETIEMGDFRNRPGDFANSLVLNESAFGIFQHCENKNKLEKALSWMSLIVSNISDSSAHAGDFYDTKAQLLYKLKRKEEALTLEARAMKIAYKSKSIKEVYRKMLEGQPTW